MDAPGPRFELLDDGRGVTWRRFKDYLDRDEAGQEARVEFCNTLGQALGSTSQILRVSGYMMRDKRLEAASILTEIASDLIKATGTLLEANLPYAAAVLIRQLIEVEYLAWLFSQDATESERWLTSDSDTLRRAFAPSTIRKRSDGKFSASEYASHCEVGGHPHPRARALLSSWSEGSTNRWMWTELARHSWRVWAHVAVIVKPKAEIPAKVLEDVESAYERWKAADFAATMTLRRSPFES